MVWWARRPSRTRTIGNVTRRSLDLVGPRLFHLNLQRPDGSHRPSMVFWDRRPLRTRGTIGTFQGGPPTTLWGPGPSLGPCLGPLSHLNLQRGDGSLRPSMVFWARRPLRTMGTIGNVPGRSPDRPLGPRPVPQALSCPVISFEPPTRGWLAEAINGTVFVPPGGP